MVIVSTRTATLTPMMVAIVLGAGASRRLGRPKQTLPLGDTTLLGWVVRDVERSSLDRVVVVTDAATRSALPELSSGRSRLVEPVMPSDGCSASLRAGLDAAGECDAVMLLLGDMAGVDASVIDAVADGWLERRPWGMVTGYQDGPGHPFVFAAEALPELRGLHGDKAVWKLFGRNDGRIVTQPVPRRRPLDVDTQEDYRTVQATLAPGIT
jgi:molybdenum cofactor cytidylyltransferase